MNYSVYAVVAMVVIAVLALLLKKSGKKPGAKSSLVVGKNAIVTEDIVNDKQSGKVKLDGKEWLAQSEDGTEIYKNSKVVVKKVSGDKLTVEVVRFTAPLTYI